MEKQFYTCKKEKIDGHGWSDSGENDALALYVLHAFFPWTASFCCLSGSDRLDKASILSYSLGLRVGKKGSLNEEKGKGFFSSVLIDNKTPTPGEKGDNSEVVVQRTPPHCRV